MLVNTEGLPGPVTVKRLGKFGTPRPKKVRGPAAHSDPKVAPLRPEMFIFNRLPVIASNPVAKTSASNLNSVPLAETPFLVIRSMPVVEISTRVTWSLLKVS